MWAQFEHLHPAPPPPQPNPGPTGACRAENKQRVTHKLARTHTHTETPDYIEAHYLLRLLGNQTETHTSQHNG